MLSVVAAWSLMRLGRSRHFLPESGDRPLPSVSVAVARAFWAVVATGCVLGVLYRHVTHPPVAKHAKHAKLVATKPTTTTPTTPVTPGGGTSPTARAAATAPTAQIPGDDIYCTTAQRFTADLHTPPVVALLSTKLQGGTRAGVKAISLSDGWVASQCNRASMSARVTLTPSSVRSRFSSRMRSDTGSLETLSDGSAESALK